MDDKLLYPYCCVLRAEAGEVALHHRTTSPAHIMLLELSTRETLEAIQAIGMIPPACTPSRAPLKGYRLELSSPEHLALEYAQARILQQLRRGDKVALEENLTDRYVLTQWAHCYVTEQPSVPMRRGGRKTGNEYHHLAQLKLLVVV